MSEKELVALLRLKNPKAFKQVQQYYRMCRNLARKSNISEEDSKDLFQDSVIVLYENLQKPDFKLSSKVSTYLYSVFQNKMYAFARKAKPTDPIQDEKIMHYDSEPESRWSEEKILQALGELGNNCSELISAYYYHRERLKTLAKELGYSSENTAKQAKYKCMQKLKNKLIRLSS